MQVRTSTYNTGCLLGISRQTATVTGGVELEAYLVGRCSAAHLLVHALMPPAQNNTAPSMLYNDVIYIIPPAVGAADSSRQVPVDSPAIIAAAEHRI